MMVARIDETRLILVDRLDVCILKGNPSTMTQG